MKSRHMHGFTLLEVLVAILLIGLMISVLVGALGQLMQSNHQTVLKSEAAIVAKKVMDGLRIKDPAQMPTTGSSAAENVDSGERIFSTRVIYCPNSNASGYCTGSARQIRVEVSYNSRVELTVDTVFTSVNSTSN